MKVLALIILFSIVLYNLQMFLGRGLSYVMIGIISILSLFFMGKVLLLRVNAVVKAYTFLVFVSIMSFIITYSSGSDSDLHILFKDTMLGLLPFFPFYYFGRNNVDLQKVFSLWLLLLIPTLYFNYIEVNSIKQEYSDNVVNDISFYYVMLLPLIVLTETKKIISFCYMALIAYIVIEGSKRGAMVAYFGGFGIYYLYLKKSLTESNVITRYLSPLLLVGIFGFGLYELLQDNTFFLERIFDFENTSGRDNIFLSLYSFWTANANVINVLFGFGFAATFTEIGKYAHNDFVEMFFNYGLMGLISYVMIIFFVIKTAFKTNNIKLKYSLYMILTIWILLVLTTGLVNTPVFSFWMIPMGYILGLLHSKK